MIPPISGGRTGWLAEQVGLQDRLNRLNDRRPGVPWRRPGPSCRLEGDTPTAIPPTLSRTPISVGRSGRVSCQFSASVAVADGPVQVRLETLPGVERGLRADLWLPIDPQPESVPDIVVDVQVVLDAGLAERGLEAGD